MMNTAATNPINYDFIPFAEGELAAFNALPDTERQRWHARAFNLNRRALKSGQEGRVTGRELYALIHRHDNQCAYCDKPLEWSEGAGRDQAPQAQNSDAAGTIDHNVPLNLGGAGDVTNLLPTCWHCNKEMNQWDRRNFDKNIVPVKNVESNPLVDTEPVYSATNPINSEYAKAAVAPVVQNYPGGWQSLLDDIESLGGEDMSGYQRLKAIVGEHYMGDIFSWITLFNTFAAGLQEAWDLEQNYRTSVNKVQVRCPNCGTLGDLSVCPKCGKGLEPEWNKIEQGKDVPWESLPQMGTPQNEFRTDPTDLVPKVEWGKQDNQFGSMLSSVRVTVDDSESWMAPEAPPADLEGHGDIVRLQGPEVNRYLEDRFPDLEYNRCPQCGESDQIDTNLGYHCLNCDSWEEGGKERKDKAFLATPDGQAYQDQMRLLEERATVNPDEF